MSDYRDDREAARARIETLEAKLHERDAALAARDAELAEIRIEMERLHSDPSRPTRGVSPIAVLAITAIAAIAGAMFALMTVGRPAASPAPVPPPASTAPAPTPTPTPAPDATAGIAEAIRRVQPEVKRCYQHELDTHPNLSGRVMVDLTVSGRKVSRVALQPSTVRTPAFDACVTKVLSGLAMPMDDGQVQVPFVFQGK